MLERRRPGVGQLPVCGDGLLDRGKGLFPAVRPPRVRSQPSAAVALLQRAECLLQPAVPSEHEPTTPNFGEDRLAVRVEEGPQAGYRWSHRLIQQFR
jgi:hypothetical protein